ncbi:flagellar protein (FlbD) [Oxobacter pfennigii]|uniref:Flagellar protein (FlbD) n=1 Tax=Oxobacter pfennigii TaxID=36849 RepID=A0A0N8NTF6_9CLOT|nr:flagellar FlbD family protein [Oxobacter pfennigii]KPU44696.1 flagellar protein (FlbD) [Oxobacter pfennigii]
MIKLTGLNNREFYLNCELIEKIEVTPDTIISTTSDKKYVVKESPEVIIKSIIDFKRKYMMSIPEVIK